MIKGVLLDIDGTLVLSNDAHAKSWVGALAKFGYHVEYSAVRPLIGMGSDKLLPQLVEGLDSESNHGKKISKVREEIFLKEYAKDLKPTPGSRALVAKFKDAGLKLMAASSAGSQTLKCLLKAAQVDDLLTQATTSDDAGKSKPDPDIVHAALEKINLDPTDVLMVGDTPYDIEAAGRAGVQVVAVRCGGWKDKNLEGAIAIYDDPADILAQFETSPFAMT